MKSPLNCSHKLKCSMINKFRRMKKQRRDIRKENRVFQHINDLWKTKMQESTSLGKMMKIYQILSSKKMRILDCLALIYKLYKINRRKLRKELHKLMSNTKNTLIIYIRTVLDPVN